MLPTCCSQDLFSIYLKIAVLRGLNNCNLQSSFATNLCHDNIKVWIYPLNIIIQHRPVPGVLLTIVFRLLFSDLLLQLLNLSVCFSIIDNSSKKKFVKMTQICPDLPPPSQCEFLHFFSIEKVPFRSHDHSCKLCAPFQQSSTVYLKSCFI